MAGKRTLADFQSQSIIQQQNYFNFHQNLQNQQMFGMHMRSVKPRFKNNSSPIDLSCATLPNMSSFSSSPANLTAGYELPMYQNLQSQPRNLNNQRLLPNLVQEPVTAEERKRVFRQIEKDLLEDDDEEEEWQSWISAPFSSSPSVESSAPVISPTDGNNRGYDTKELLMEAVAAISDGNSVAGGEIIETIFRQGLNRNGNSDERMVFYMTDALKSRINPPPSASELYGTEQIDSTQLLFQHSSAFKLSIIAANLAIIESTSDTKSFNIVEFNIGPLLQYESLFKFLSHRKSGKPTVIKITILQENINDEEQRFMKSRQKLNQLADRAGISVQFNDLPFNIKNLSRESIGLDSDDVIVVNMAYTLSRMADESVSVENPRDELLRRVKGLRPRVTILIEQEMNCNTTQFGYRVNECYNYYRALMESLDYSTPMEDSDRVKLEQGLSRRICNTVAREGPERLERCEVFGKWKARMGMAGFQLKPVSQQISLSLQSTVRSLTGGNPAFAVKLENGTASFSWMGRILTVTSAWC